MHRHGAAVTEFESIDVHRGDDGIPRDRYGRYVLPPVDGGKPRAWRRATTLAEVLKERRGLEKWSQRNIIYGMGQRPALVAKAAAATLDDRKTLDAIAKRAQEAADADAGADVGTALHTFAERIDRGEQKIMIPPPYDRDMEAYTLALEMTGISTAVGWIERVLICPEIEIVGTADRLNVSSEWTLPRIGDIKTATDKVQGDGRVVNSVLEHGMADIPLQLAIYAHATHWWDVRAEQWIEMPTVDQDKAMVLHVPAGVGECRIYEIDIAAGWEAVQLAMATMEWRKRKDLAEMLISVSAPDSAGSGPDAPESESAGDALPPAEPADSTIATQGDDDGRGGSEAGVVSGKGGEAGSFPAEDPPASTPSASTFPLAGPVTIETPASTEQVTRETPISVKFHQRFEWCRERVETIKGHDNARARLAGLWSLRSEIPTFPKGGPRDADELSAIVGICDLIEMEFQMPFGPPDPAATQVGPTPAEKRRDEHDQAEAAKEAAMSKARNRRKPREKKT
jgi:hypothetical protein